jgi:serine/threonine protein kinase/formylglycine-generating enzyme required for sulfatase activity
MNFDTELLLAALAVQNGFVSKDQIGEACAAWASDPTRGLAAILEERGFLSAETRSALDAVIRARLERGGDPRKILGALPLDDEVRRIFCGLPLRGAARETLLVWQAARPGTPARLPQGAAAGGEATMDETPADPAVPAPGAAQLRAGETERYEFRRELGRGGLGRVIEAMDRDFGREVALKMMLPGQPPSAVERFLLEARAAGRLSHPNIVPVHEIGVLKSGQGESPYFTMAKIAGRDLAQILADLDRGDGPTRARFNRHRLLRIFQEVCNGMAYAHDHGVIHRDLKPANVMVGEYGEVFVVDWGLAKVMGGTGSSDRTDRSDLSDRTVGPRAGREHGTALTLEGTVLGTPAYMPPEQAEGRIGDIDERSDIYSLGAILYEILTLRPPFTGGSAADVISKVITAEVTPPSSVVREANGSPPASVPAGGIPGELDAIVLKALSKKREDRHLSARELSEEVQLFLEGEKEHERRRGEAEEKIEQGRRHFARFRELGLEIEHGSKELEGAWKEVKPWRPVEDKRPIWEEQERLRKLAEERMGEFGKAEVAFGGALQADAANPGGWEGRSDLYLERYFSAERGADAEGMALYRSLLEHHDVSGKCRAEIHKPGSLSIRTFTRPCDCLASVKDPRRSRPLENPGAWRVLFSEDTPVTWREGRPFPGERVLELDKPIPGTTTSPEGVRFGHLDSCPREDLEGVEVSIRKYEEKDLRLQPGPERVLGRTPLVGVRLDIGSYVCRLRREGFAEALLPVRIVRGGKWEQDVALYRAWEVPDGFRQVPAGPFVMAGHVDSNGPARPGATQDFFIARFPVTFGEYIAFLDDLAASNPAEARARQPREGAQTFLEEANGRFAVSQRKERNPLGLSDAMPVMGVSWLDAMAFCAWKSTREGKVFTPPHEEEWEKAARGVDGREYPWGREYDGTFSNTTVSFQAGPRIVEPGRFPCDESPYGAMDMAGNMVSWCLNAGGGKFGSVRLLRGGAWFNAPGYGKCAYRWGNGPSFVYRSNGFRLCVRPWAMPGPAAALPS